MRDQYHDWQRQLIPILLMFDTLICGYERIETVNLSKSQQIAVTSTNPSHTLDSACFKRVGKTRSELPRNGFVKQ